MRYIFSSIVHNTFVANFLSEKLAIFFSLLVCNFFRNGLIQLSINSKNRSVFAKLLTRQLYEIGRCFDTVRKVDASFLTKFCNTWRLLSSWTQNVNWTYIRRSEDVQGVFWISYVPLVYVLHLADWDLLAPL